MASCLLENVSDVYKWKSRICQQGKKIHKAISSEAGKFGECEINVKFPNHMHWGACLKKTSAWRPVSTNAVLQIERIFRGKNGKGAFYPAGFKIFDVNDFLNLKMKLKRIMKNMVELNQSSLGLESRRFVLVCLCRAQHRFASFHLGAELVTDKFDHF